MHAAKHADNLLMVPIYRTTLYFDLTFYVLRAWYTHVRGISLLMTISQ